MYFIKFLLFLFIFKPFGEEAVLIKNTKLYLFLKEEIKTIPLIGDPLDMDVTDENFYILTDKSILCFDKKGNIKASTVVYSYANKIFVYDDNNILLPSSDFLNIYKIKGQKIKLKISVGISPYYTDVVKTKRGLFFFYPNGRIEIFEIKSRRIKDVNLKTRFKNPCIAKDFIYWMDKNNIYTAGIWSLKKRRIKKIERVKKITPWRDKIIAEKENKIMILDGMGIRNEIVINYDSLLFTPQSDIMLVFSKDSICILSLPLLKIVSSYKKSHPEELVFPFRDSILRLHLKKEKIVKKQEKRENLYALQIGAFREEDNAKRTAEELKKTKIPFYIKKENELFKIRVGCFLKKEEAYEFKRFLTKYNPWVVKDIPPTQETYRFNLFLNDTLYYFIYKQGIIYQE